MKTIYSATIFLVIFATHFATHFATAQTIPNPLIDYDEFQRIVVSSKSERESHRLTEAQFLTSREDSATIILDARSSARFQQRHIKGAINLPFTEFTAETLQNVIPSKDSKIVIYCNNNFLGDPVALASKMLSASLNLNTYTSLKAYGYTNIYELGPLLDVATTSIPFEGSLVR
jgi:hypothetical protein